MLGHVPSVQTRTAGDVSGRHMLEPVVRTRPIQRASLLVLNSCCKGDIWSTDRLCADFSRQAAGPAHALEAILGLGQGHALLAARAPEVAL